MCRGLGCAVVIMGLWLAQAASASAKTLCVPSTAIPGCPSGAPSEPDIQTAVGAAASSGDTILIGPDSANKGPYKQTITDNGKSITFIGAGPTKTITQAQGSPGMTISSGSSVSNLGIQVYTGPGNTGLQLAGRATHVAITAQPGVTYCTGVALAGGAFRHGTVSLPTNVSEPMNGGYGGVVGNGTVSDSAITAAVGVGPDTSYIVPRVTRDRIRANQGILVALTSPVIEDSLIRTVAGPSTEMGVSLSPNVMQGSFTIRHTTIAGSHTAGSVGVYAHADGLTNPTFTSVLIDSTIIRGYVNSIEAVATTSGSFQATTTVTVRRTFYDPAASHTSSSGGPAQATINRDSHSGNHNPLFVSPATGNFQLQAGSPAIDAGSPTLASGESTTDLAGKPRRIPGRSGDATISDVGAYEFRPHIPTVHATASRSHAGAGQSVTFHATGTDASPGDVLAFRWSFGGGSSAAGATVSHRFAKPGKYKVSVTAIDLDRFTATASIRIAVR